MVHDLGDQLDLLIRSRTPILWIRSLEEERVEGLLERAAQRLGAAPCCAGTSSAG